MQTLAQRVAEYIRKHELLKAGDGVGAAVSGGADSVAMLRLLLELRREIGIVLSVVHFNHKLRGAESEADEQFVAELSRSHGLAWHVENGDVARHAAEKHLSLETAAREMRYAYFCRLLREGVMNRIATAHTLDDQAETVLLRLARGAGTRGLAGIYPQLLEESRQVSIVRHQTGPSIIRPLLAIRRRDLEPYLNSLGQGWREDSSNRDLRHARNRIRHGLLPRMERNLNPAIREALAETAEIARAEEEYWEREVGRALPSVCEAAAGGRRDHQRDTGATLVLAELMTLPLALRRRTVRAVAEFLGLGLEFRQVEEILAVSAGASKSVGLTNGWMVSRDKHTLRFERTGMEPKLTAPDYEYCLPIPGKVRLLEAGLWLEAMWVSADAAPGYNPDHLLDASLVSKELRVRNWRAGDRFWPAYTKAPRKIKELLEQRHLTGATRKTWPVVVMGDEVVWLRGFPAPQELRPRDGKEALLIRECET